MANDSKPYILTVWAADGSLVRRREYRTCREAGLSDAAPTLEELIAGHRGEVRRRRGTLRWSFEPVNPKVLPLVKALFAAGVETTGSGDMYGDDLVYVDLADGWDRAAARTMLPTGWIVSAKLADVAREALGLPPQTYDFPGEPVEGVQGDEDEEPGPAVGLCRRGGRVTRHEAADITNSLLRAAGK